MAMHRREKLTCTLLLLFGLPFLAHANAGTALMWGQMLHLAFGNILIGVIEGLLLGVLLKQSKSKCIGLMIVANYFSAWVGFLGLGFWGDRFLTWSLYDVRSLLLLMVILCWLATVLLEWPFVWLCQGHGACRWLPALKRSLLVQTVSYVLLVGWYLLCGEYSLLTRCHFVQPDEMALREKLCVYYVSSADGHVHGLRPGEKPFKVAELPSDETPYQLICERSAPGAATATLKAIRFKKHRSTDKVVQIVDVLPDFAPADRVLLEPDREEADEAYPDRGTDDDKPFIDASWYWVGRPLGAARDSSIRFSSGFWAAQGLRLLTKVERPRGRRPSPDRYGFDWGEWETTRRLFALETPFLAWRIRDIIQLPDDVVLLRLGDQLCLFDYRTMRIALLARGHGATVVLEE